MSDRERERYDRLVTTFGEPLTSLEELVMKTLSKWLGEQELTALLTLAERMGEPCRRLVAEVHEHAQRGEPGDAGYTVVYLPPSTVRRIAERAK